MKKHVVIVVWVIALAVSNVQARDLDAPLWLHVLSWYVGVAIWFSLYVPIRTGRTFDTLKEVSPQMRVLVGLVWPVYMAVWFVARYL